MYLLRHVKAANYSDLVVVCWVPRLIKSKEVSYWTVRRVFFRRLAGDLMGLSTKQITECAGRLISL